VTRDDKRVDPWRTSNALPKKTKAANERVVWASGSGSDSPGACRVKRDPKVIRVILAVREGKRLETGMPWFRAGGEGA
jgi:hypothetical protein